MSRYAITLTTIPTAGAYIYGADTPLDLGPTSRTRAAELFAADPARQAVVIQINKACEVCDGSGQAPGKRRSPLRQIPKAKNCNGGWFVMWKETIRRIDYELDSIKVLWRQPDLLTLWGIPYEMREGQSPADLWRAHHKYQEPKSGVYGSPQVSLSDWIYLGQPRWWANHDTERRLAAEVFLKCISKDAIPNHPNEWSRLAR